MIKRYLAPFILGFALLSPLTPVQAGIPVIDGVQTVRDIFQYLVQIQHWITQINSYKQQAQDMEKDFKSTIGSRNIGQLLNSVSDKQFRQYLPADWDSAISAIDQAGSFTSELDAEIRSIEASLQHTKASNMYADPGTQQALDYERRRKEAIAAMSIAKGIFNRGKQQIAKIEQLMGQVDNGANDQKAAIDLNSRMSAQVAMLNAQTLQVQAAMSKQLAEQSNYWNELDARNAKNANHVTSTRYD